MASFTGKTELRLCDIPVYLQEGEYYKALNKDNIEDVISIPVHTVKPSVEVATTEELLNLLQSLQFWIVTAIPITAVTFILEHSSACLELCRQFACDFPQLRNLLSIAEMQTTDNQLSAAVRLQAVQILIENGASVNENHTLLTAETGHIHVLRYLYHYMGALHCDTTVRSAANGSLECLQFAVRHGCTVSHSAVIEAAEAGHVSILQYLHSRGVTFTAQAARVVAHNGHLECLAFLHANGCPLDDTVANSAVKGGQLACLQYLHQHCGCALRRETMLAALSAASLECLEYALSHGTTEGVADKVVTLAADHKRLPCLWALQQHGVSLAVPAALERAALEGCYDCIVLLHEGGCPLASVNACENAAAGSNGDLEERLRCLQYLHEHGCPWDEWTTLKAAENGYLEMLQYAHQQGCPLIAEACVMAAEKGRVECLRYLLDQGLAPTTRTAVAAASGGHLDCLQLLRRHGCP